MKRIIAQHELRNDNASIIEVVGTGDSLVATRDGVPIAELRPIPTARRRLIPKNELGLLASVGPQIDLGELRADLGRVVEHGRTTGAGMLGPLGEVIGSERRSARRCEGRSRASNPLDGSAPLAWPPWQDERAAIRP
jgi:antitoxin (DNA-binding transcriptional repressor) of toxin-antitoxin stability system